LALSRIFYKFGYNSNQFVDVRVLRTVLDSLLLAPSDHPCRGSLLRLFVSLVFSLGSSITAVQTVFADFLSGARVTNASLVEFF
jgi:hypothetical protein